MRVAVLSALAATASCYQLAAAPPRRAFRTTTPTASEESLLSLLSASGSEGRGASLSAGDVSQVHSLATALEDAKQTDTNESPLLPGRWRVLYQGKPGGETVSAFSLESWQKYLSGDGPSPIQNLVSGFQHIIAV